MSRSTGTQQPGNGPALPQGIVLARRFVRPALSEWLGQLDAELSEICHYHFGIDRLGGNADGGGKLIRPAFSLLCASAAGGNPADAIAPAVAIELLHNASLIHDDIMDGDRERRHRPAVWARFGVSWAILAGDALIALGFEALASGSACAAAATAEDLARILRKLALGQASDLRYEQDTHITERECLTMLERKTGVLFGYACKAGAQYAGAPDHCTARFEWFGANLGIAFQLIDDIQGVWGDPRVTGKPAGSDIRARKGSGPITIALHSASAAGARLRQLYSRERDLTSDELGLAASLIEEAGGRLWAEGEARRRLEMAWDMIDDLDLVPSARNDLEELTTTLMAGRAVAPDARIVQTV
jgi:geranylgeranyl diphosphate synthase type I